jgi:hypothetical protein
MKKETIPTEADWDSESWGIDTPCAYGHFFGKSHNEAVAMFLDNSGLYSEDVFFMPCVVYGFYIRDFAGYILSDKSKDDDQAASGFVLCAERGVKKCHHALRENLDIILPALDRIYVNQEYFNAPKDIYTDFKERIDLIKKNV